jgi:hypothetical protein
MSGFSLPTVVWLDDADRARLMEIAQRADAPTERVGGRLLSKALLLHTAGEFRLQEPKAVITRAGKAGRQYIAPRSRKQG